MSHDIVGADLAQLEELSAAFQTAGTEIAARAGTLDTKIQNAIVRFEATLSSMQNESTTLASTIDDEIDAVAIQADGVEWTGSNRTAFDGDLGAFKTAVTTGTSQINTDIAAIKTQIDASFNPVLADFGVALQRSGDDVNTATTDMDTAVSNQRTNLDQAANGNWYV